ncbi:hypothetical protein IP70_20270 [alpha proteobacterium AAP38]|uniref:hypothetical protein n=1 Tax=Niveispirillum sp. TaxID=1917217 RepID=UPI0006B8BD03|nr:hypothetical protein IP70_20270 [alpha proteobacterium AAP38]
MMALSRSALLGLGLLLTAMPAWAEKLPVPAAAFSASQNLTVDGVALSARIFHDKGLERRESRVDGLNNLLIIRPDQGEALVVQPESNMGMKLPLTDPEVGMVASSIAQLSGTREGNETLSGETVTRYRVQDITPDGAGFDGRVWATRDGIYVKMEGRTGGEGAASIAMTLTDIRRGPQDPALFTPPAGLSVMTLDPMEGRMPPAFQADKEKAAKERAPK